jgi:hypothetical protein
MSPRSSTSTSPRRPPGGRPRLRRVALSAVAVTVGAIVLSGCVVIQSESALQTNVIGNSITVTTTLCASQAAAAAPCNGNGNSGKAVVPGASAPGQLLVGYRIPVGVTAPATLTTSVPSTDENGAPITVSLTLAQNAQYAAGLTSLLPPPAGTQWVGYASDIRNYTATGPQSVVLTPTFGLPDGFAGPFTWRTVVGFRAKVFVDQSIPISCPAPFPGTSYVSPALTQLPSVCVDSPDAATINGPPSSYATGNLSIVAPATPTIPAGSSVSLGFTGLFSGSNPTGGVFAVAASTTIPGVTPSVTPTFAPGPDSSNPLAVSFAVPATTHVGTYDVTVSATVGGLTRTGTGHITVKAPAASAASAGKKAKLTSSVKTTTLKVARKTGIPVTLKLSRASSISLIALQTKPKVSITVHKKLKRGKKIVVLIKSAKLHKGKVTITFKGGGVTRVLTTTLS